MDELVLEELLFYSDYGEIFEYEEK